MNKQQRGVIFIRLGLMLIIIAILVSSIACWGSPLFDLIIENQTTQVLTVDVNYQRVGEVGPGEQITEEDIPWHGEHIVEAKNSQGEVVFSRVFTLETMQEIKRGKVYKVVIPPE